ncbi:MAG: Glutaminase [Chthonomonadales bacterium]|nr:Glutaminase [Chthonomonadales bacterium]
MNISKRLAWTGLLSLGVWLGTGAGADAQARTALRPPAVPLVTFNPYLSIWSEADRLTDDVTRHWTHREQALDSLIRVDGKSYRLMGAEPKLVPALPQVALRVLPTRSIYDFDDGHIHVTMTFMTAALPTDLNALARPLSYITWNVRSVDGASHSVSLYDSASSALAVNRTNQAVDWKREAMGALTSLRAGTRAQKILGSSGDDHQLDWGYAYLVAPAAQTRAAMGSSRTLLDAFVSAGKLPADDTLMPRPVSDANPTLAVTFDLGKVGAAAVSRHVMVGYDEIYSILYFRRKLRPYWRRNGATPATMFQEAERDYASLTRRCEAFDRELMADMTKAGGAKYAQMTALSYRECVAACGLAADTNGQPLFFTKENTSNGDIATVDVIFPMDPIWVFLSPSLAKASLVPIFAYAASDHWKFPNAPHDLGTYPIARGTDDGGEGMPVEESGNMLILCDAIAQAEGSPEFVAKWWPQMTQWAEYLEKYGLDPEEQLCTDDFMGHLAHNANLSVKAILGLAAYGDLCRMRGDAKNAAKYLKEARVDAQHWIQVTEDNGHSRLAFDKPNTWSQKYNLVWDEFLGLHIFPPFVAKQEVNFY